MTIAWKTNADEALAEASGAGRHVLMDFNAAPM